jgi:hypothetical protein
MLANNCTDDEGFEACHPTPSNPFHLRPDRSPTFNLRPQALLDQAAPLRDQIEQPLVKSNLKLLEIMPVCLLLCDRLIVAPESLNCKSRPILIKQHCKMSEAQPLRNQIITTHCQIQLLKCCESTPLPSASRTRRAGSDYA